MAILIDLQIEDGQQPVPAEADFLRWVSAALLESHAQLEQTICIVDEAGSRALNHRYRGKDSATNVLAFPIDDAAPGAEYLDYDCLGDLVLCAPLVAREAEQQGKTEAAHWAHLVVHGMLHLQGYDHRDEQEAAGMEALEVEILGTLGYTNPYNDFPGKRDEG